MIRVLPTAVVNQIAAGEVIERPFSIVKELVENSLDAGSKRIIVEIAEGGRSLVKVTDDGVGIGEGDLALAFVSHATSKLSTASDLDHIASLGFRGEALASIGSVARAQIRSRVPGDDSGYAVVAEGGVVAAVSPCGCPPGTAVEVRDLFYNTPARRRFLRTPGAERARIQDMVVRLALPRLDVDFTLHVDGRKTLHLPTGESLRERVTRAFGRDLGSSLIEVSRGSGDYRVDGLIADPDAARRSSTLELLYVNGRGARDRAVTFAVRQAYRAYLMHGRYPAYFLMLSLPPEDVDVNVHPTKAEVRFHHSRRVGGLLHDAAAAALLTRGQHRRVLGGTAAAGSVAEGKPAAQTGFPDLPAGLFGQTSPPVEPLRPARGRLVAHDAAGSEVPAERAHPFRRLERPRFLQVMQLYLVLESADGLMVVDQHALHERVMFEQLTSRHDGKPVAVQRLLVPEIIELTSADKQYLLAARDVLAESGFLIEDFGGISVAVQGIPAVLHRSRPAALVRSFLQGPDGDARPRAREAILERFHSAACRRSVMSGDPLRDEEIEALLRDAATLEHPHNCPHGRPTVVNFSSGELERFFRRRV